MKDIIITPSAPTPYPDPNQRTVITSAPTHTLPTTGSLPVSYGTPAGAGDLWWENGSRRQLYLIHHLSCEPSCDGLMGGVLKKASALTS